MDWIFVLGVVISVVLCVLTFISIYITLGRRKYSHIPGPPIDNFFLGHVPLFSKYVKEGKFFNAMTLDLCKKYGPVFKMNFMHSTFVFTSDPQAVRELQITGNHPKSYITLEGIIYLFSERFFGKSLVSETDQKVWVWRRQLMNPCFQKSYLRGLESALNTEIDLLITRLAGLADGKTEVSMLDEFNHLTLDIIGKIAFGMQMNNVVNRTEKSEFTKAIQLCFRGISENVRNPFFKYNFFNWNFINDVRKALRFLRVFSKQCFEERKAAIERGDYTPDDILNHIVKMKLENPELDDEVIVDDIIVFFVAGQETTACLLSFTMICLWQNKDVLERLRTEVFDIVGMKSYLSIEDVNKMKYLEMVIKESLRLYPPGPNTFREPKHDIEILGYKIPAGTPVAMSTYVSSRLEEFFPDPLKFFPERFSPNAENKITSYTYYPFTLGPRTCIGKSFAEIEAKIILAKIIQRFNFEMDPDQSFDIEESTTLKPEGGAVCTLTLCDSFEG